MGYEEDFEENSAKSEDVLDNKDVEDGTWKAESLAKSSSNDFK